IDIFMQRADRAQSRNIFRSVAKSMADRYLRRHPVFQRRPWRGFSTLLFTEPPSLTEQSVRRLSEDLDKTQARLKIPPQRRNLLEKEVERYVSGAKNQD